MSETESPTSKKVKVDEANVSKRRQEDEPSSSKRVKNELCSKQSNSKDTIQALMRKNFITACKQVSFLSYTDYSRFNTDYIPEILDHKSIDHQCRKCSTEIPDNAVELVNIEMKSNMWSEALEICQLTITDINYLSPSVLKHIIEIIMNAHEDSEGEYSITELIRRCQLILTDHYTIHPPCTHKGTRSCYQKFLTSPMDIKDKTFTNRLEYGSDRGILKYCLNRLEYELSAESKDGPLVDKETNIPKEMKQSLKGLHWQKEKFEIFEVLERGERLARLMAALESVAELLQYDLAVWHVRYTSNQGTRVMKSHRPLMAHSLWSDALPHTGALTHNCRQILRLHAHLVHLGYPQSYVDTMGILLNTMIQTVYLCETNSNNDYPNIGIYCTRFAEGFYKLISKDLPYSSVLKVIQTIRPTFMLHLVSVIHAKELLNTKEDDILKILIEFFKKSRWKEFATSDEKLVMDKTAFSSKPKKIEEEVKAVLHEIEMLLKSEDAEDNNTFAKIKDSSVVENSDVDLNHVINTLSISLIAYLDAYQVWKVQETIKDLNDQLERNNDLDNSQDPLNGQSYVVTEGFIKKYRTIYQQLSEFKTLYTNAKEDKNFPASCKVFRNVIKDFNFHIKK